MRIETKRNAGVCGGVYSVGEAGHHNIIFETKCDFIRAPRMNAQVDFSLFAYNLTKVERYDYRQYLDFRNAYFRFKELP